MADQKITALTAHTALIDTDVLPVVDITAVETKKSTWANIKSVLNTYFSTLYAVLAGVSGGQTLNGGTDANDDITIQGTSNATRTSSYVILQPSGGNVGIGTTGPVSPLEIQSAGDKNILKMSASSVGTGYLYSQIINTGANFQYGVDSSVGGQMMSGTLAYSSSILTGNPTALHFGTNGAIRQTITDTGNVGIGTASPNHPLTISSAT